MNSNVSMKWLDTLIFLFHFRYLQKQSPTLFNVNDYTVAPPEYHRKAI